MLSTVLANRGCSCMVFVVGIAVAYAIQMLQLECNFHWLQVLATYPEIEGYPLSRALGDLLDQHLRPQREEHCRSGTNVGEFSLNNAPNVATWPSLTSPFTIRNAFDASRGFSPLLDRYGGEIQNQWKPCEKSVPLTPFGGDRVPCSNSTLAALLTTLNRSHSDSATWQVFTKILTSHTTGDEARFLTDAYNTSEEHAHVHKHSATWPRNVMIWSRDRTPLTYFHAHPDFFVVHNVVGVKEWNLLPPSFIPDVQAVWSGLTLMASRVPTTPCIAKTLQKPGDILVVPTWWLHNTKLYTEASADDTIAHVGYSQHFSPKRSIFGPALYLFEELMGPGYEMVTKLAPSAKFLQAVADVNQSDAVLWQNTETP